VTNLTPPGVPTKDYRLPTEWVSPGSVVFNVSHFKNVDEETLLKVRHS
jgi:methylenetetrahydrofolate dehydrogenase (NAD+)